MGNVISKRLFEEAQEVMPGGVNSPVRAYKTVGLTPPFIKKAYGSKIVDVDDNEYIDYIGSWGPMILGHAHKDVINAIKETLDNGTSFGAPTEKEVTLAKMICDLVPSVEMVRMVSSGTEAVMSAIRLARGFTGRDKIVKFEGCYHGHSDGLLVKAGSGALTTGVPDSAGVPKDFAKNTITGTYNDTNSIKKIFENHGNDIGAVIIEPVAGNMGVIPPDIEYLKELRAITFKYGALLIFDEVITGFRMSISGAQGIVDIKPDLTVFGKIIGGGMPVGAYGGRRDIMSKISPLGPVYQAGTLSGNPIAMISGIKTLEILRDNKDIYENISKRGEQLEKAFLEKSKKYSIPLVVNRVGSLMTAFFTEKEVKDYKGAVGSNVEMFIEYFKGMLEQKIYLAPSQFEGLFLSNAHDDKDIKNTIDSIDFVFYNIAKK